VEEDKLRFQKIEEKEMESLLKLAGASGNNLKNVTAEFPLGKMICVTGVSGSGKSTLINETLYPILNKHIYRGVKEPMPYKKITGSRTCR
jgi:excinuclease ABC subunit A